jgi:hypothetical protein
MSVLKFNARVALVALAMLAASAQAARAETITLVCNTGVSRAAPDTIDLDEAKGLATVHYGGITMSNGQVTPVYKPPPSPATFTKNTIRFSEHGDDQGKRDVDFTINRLTGIVDLVVTVDGQRYHNQWTCDVGKAKF